MVKAGTVFYCNALEMKPLTVIDYQNTLEKNDEN